MSIRLICSDIDGTLLQYGRKELVGEIWDEHDEVTEDFRKQSDGSWIVLGSAGVDDLYERLGLPEDEDIDSNTVNGLVQEKTCRLPKVGDRFTLGSYDSCVISGDVIVIPHKSWMTDSGNPFNTRTGIGLQASKDICGGELGDSSATRRKRNDLQCV